MSVHQNIPYSELGTQNSTIAANKGSFSATQKDERGTPPIQLNPIQTIRLRLMFLTSRFLRLANDEMKNMLFTHPFDVFLGADKKNVLKQTFKDSIVSEYWMPALKKIHDWLVQFGIAPYKIRPMVFPSITSQFDLAELKKDTSKKKTKSDSNDGETYEEKEEEGKKERTVERAPEIMTQSRSAEKGGKSSGKKKPKSSSSSSSSYYPSSYTGCVIYGGETHNIVEIPDFDSGFISTYVDSDFNQQFLWTWYPNAVPQTFDNRDGYTDPDVKFIVKDPPTIKGEYTCPLRTAIKEWLYLNSRKKMDSLSMRDRLNPVLFVEKQEPHALKTPSVIDELSVNYSASFNSGHLNYQGPGNGRGGGGGGGGSNQQQGLDPATGEMNLGYGQSVKFDTTRIDGLTDVGLTNYTDGYGVPYKSEGPDYNTLVSTLEFNRRANGNLRDVGLTNSPFGFGGINDDELTTDLGGMMSTFGSDPVLTNPMSGIGYRVKKMSEGEKISEIKNNELNAYVNVTTIEQQERSLEESLCFLAGYPSTFITGRSGGGGGGGGGKGGGGKAGGGNGTKGTPSSSSSPGSFATSSDTDASKGFLIGRLRHFQVYYQHQITKLFLKCYSDSFIKSKIKLLSQLDENHWFILEQVYALKIELPIDPPPIDSSSLMNGFASGIVTPEEVIRNGRLNFGLSLDVMDDERFMANAIKKLENKYDPESQLKLQQKYTSKSDSKSGGKNEKKTEGGGGKKREDNNTKKRKASSDGNSKDNGKKTKR